MKTSTKVFLAGLALAILAGIVIGCWPNVSAKSEKPAEVTLGQSTSTATPTTPAGTSSTSTPVATTTSAPAPAPVQSTMTGQAPRTIHITIPVGN